MTETRRRLASIRSRRSSPWASSPVAQGPASRRGRLQNDAPISGFASVSLMIRTAPVYSGEAAAVIEWGFSARI